MLRHESSFLIGTNGARIGGTRIDHDAGHAAGKEPGDEGTDESRAVAASEHVGLADELIEAAGAHGLRAEADMPIADLIALQIGERPAVEADDELRQVRMVEVAADICVYTNRNLTIESLATG